MRAMLLIPIALLICAAGGYAMCRALGISVHERELISAVLTCLFAGEVAMIPMVLTRGASQVTVVQSALMGTTLHLFVCLAIATGVTFGKLVPAGPYLYWMLFFYWVTLISLVIAFAKSVRSAPAVQAPRQ